MILSGNQFLDSVRLNALVIDQSQRFQAGLPLRFLDRTKVMPAEDDELIFTFTGKVFAADLVADDQAAVVYQAGQLQPVTNSIPNLKLGMRVGQNTLNRVGRLRRRLGTANDATIFNTWQTTTLVPRLIQGVKERMNALICAMQIDGFVYDRLGIKITGSWGTPADLKVTVSPLWTDPAAPAVTQILTLKAWAKDTYGEVYDRMTLPTSDFINLASTTEFRQLIAGLVNAPLATTAFNVRDPRNVQFASQLLDLEVEPEDKQITVQNEDGTTTASRVLPLGKVILSSKADDNNGAAMDFGNGIVTESVVADLVGGPPELAGERFGPLGYYTGSADLNPPNVVGWAVGRGFPRKFRPTATAVMTVR